MTMMMAFNTMKLWHPSRRRNDWKTIERSSVIPVSTPGPCNWQTDRYTPDGRRRQIDRARRRPSGHWRRACGLRGNPFADSETTGGELRVEKCCECGLPVIVKIPPPQKHCTQICASFRFYYLRYVIPGVCLFVCLSVCRNFTYKLLNGSSWKFLPQMYLWTRKKWLNFESQQLRDPDSGMFWRILQHGEIGHFSTVWLISLERVIESTWKFYHKSNFKQGSLC